MYQAFEVIGERIIGYLKKTKKTCQELFELYYKKFLSDNFITTGRPEGANCGEWLHSE